MPRWLIALIVVSSCTGTAASLMEFGIEGFGVVSTPSNEIRASISADGRDIVWGSTDRRGGAGGWDLWRASKREGRWADPRPLQLNSSANDFDPFLSSDDRWLFFFSNRSGGLGGDDLYRAPRLPDGGFGPAENLGPAVNSAGNEWAPTLSPDGQRLMFASDGLPGAGRHDLFVARWNGRAFVEPRPVPGINTRKDEFDAAWIDEGKAIVFARSDDVDKAPVQLFLAQCNGTSYQAAHPLALSFNSASSVTLGPMVDLSKPGELLVSGMAHAPRAGQLDIYRLRTPIASGETGCL